MRLLPLHLVPLLAVAAACAQSEPPVAREGGYWVQTVSGSLPLDRPALRVQTRGALHIRGESRSNIYYVLKKRVRAASEAEARRKLSLIAIREANGLLSVFFPDRDSSADLNALVSRSLNDLTIESQGGALDVRDFGGAVKADLGGGAVQMDAIGGRVSLRTGGGSVHFGRIDGPLDCVSGGGIVTADRIGGAATVRTGGGDIVLKDVGGAIQAFTGGGGNIRVEHAGGGVNAGTAGGLIDVLRSGGAVRAEAGAGAIRVQNAKSVRCETGAGSIRLGPVSGRIHVATANGAIFAELAHGLEESVLSTALGDITVTIPSNLSVTVQALADSQGLRKIVSDFPEIRTLPEARGARAEAQGALNGGGPLLRVAATGGTVYLRRQK